MSTSTLKFEPLFEITLQQQCLEIEIISDLLSERREMFTLLFSTNNSAVQLTTPRVKVYIGADYSKYHSYCNLCNDSGIFR